MSRILKIRSMKVSSSQEGFSNGARENEMVRDSVDQQIVHGLKHSRQFFQESFQNTQQWVLDVVLSTNKGQFQNINKMYLQTVGDQQIQQTLLLNHLKTILAPTSTLSKDPTVSVQRENLYTFRVLEKIMN